MRGGLRVASQPLSTMVSERKMFHAMQNGHGGLSMGKVVIVTGSSTGIGANTAIKFAKEGAHGVVLHGRQEDKLKNVKEQCEKAGGKKTKVHIALGDITDESVRKKLVEETVKIFGRLDILVNNAGFTIKFGSMLGQPVSDLDKIYDVNVRSVVALTQLVIPHLIQSKGNIINISSTLSLITRPFSTYYSMTKAMLDMFTKHLAVELGPKGVRVNSINPGFVPETEFLRNWKNASEIPALIKQHDEMSPVGRVGKMEEISDTIVYLASNKATFVNGAILPVSGGDHLT